MAKSRIPGLYWDKETQKGKIDKRIPGIGRVFERFTASSWAQAEEKYHQTIEQARNTAPTASVPTWRMAATKYLKEETKPSLCRDANSLEILDAWIGIRHIDQVHQDTLQPFIDWRRANGFKSATVSRDLAIVRRILNLAARVWRDEQGRPWLPTAPPLIRLPDWSDDAKPYPLNWEEQRRLIQHLPAHLARMALFGLNTGVREDVICSLRWEWEMSVKELGGSVFIVPGRPNDAIDWVGTKSKQDQVIVLNAIARSVIEDCRGKNGDWVFVYKGRRIDRINNTAWRRAWKDARLPADRETLGGPNNLRHTFARRLRMAGVALETRKALMHHTDGDITVHYSPAELRELLNAVEKLCEVQHTTLLRVAR